MYSNPRLRASFAKFVCIIACFASLSTGPLLAQMPDDPNAPCTDESEGKSGLCGRAGSAKGLWDSLAEGNPIPYEAQADTDITHCFLDIAIDTTAKTVSGSNTLDVTSKINGLTQFTLDLRSNMVVDSVLVNNVARSFTRPGHQILITLGATYNLNQTFQVKVTYHGTPQNLGWQSFHFGTHGSSKPIACTLSQPWWAHTWWPCKENQEYVNDKFTMDMWVTVPNSQVVASNGLLQGTDTIAGSKLRYRWKENYPIATYLVSLTTTNYTKVTHTYNHPGGSMPVEFYLYPERLAADEPMVANVVPMITALASPTAYGEYPFINEKYGIARFTWCCGMEHQTMTSQGTFAERTNIHELAHSWWGDNVTCKTWHDTWLNEGFATFSEALWEERQSGGSYQEYINQMLSRKPSYFAGTVYCYDVSDYGRVFDQNYTYKKAGWVVHMLRWVLGSENFFGALAHYRSLFQGSNADTEDFKLAMEAYTGRDLDWFFDQWVYGGGGPYYKYGWQQVQIGSQYWVRYYVNQYQRETLPAYPYFKMPVEIAVTTGNGTTTHTVWNDQEKQWYLLPADGPVTDVQFDKDIKILHANDQSVTYVAGPPKIIAVTPAMDAVIPLGTSVTQVKVQFSEAINFNASYFSVTGSESGSRPLTATYNSGNFEVTLTFAQALPDGESYTVQVLSTLKSQTGALALDGELPGSPSALPSGDGIPGGNALYIFTLEGLPPCPDPFADVDADGDVDLSDFATLQLCRTGNGASGLFDAELCRCLVRDGDNDIDDIEFTQFRECFSGADVEVSPACDN